MRTSVEGSLPRRRHVWRPAGIDSSAFFWNWRLSTCCSYLKIAKMFKKKDDVFTFLKQQGTKTKDCNNQYKFGLVRFEDAAHLAAFREYRTIPVMAEDKQINNFYCSPFIKAYFSYPLWKSCCPCRKADTTTWGIPERSTNQGRSPSIMLFNISL